MADTNSPTITAREDEDIRQLRQVTVASDEEIETVNQLLADGWRLVAISHRGEVMVYVLGRTDRKQKGRTGFFTGRLGSDAP